MIKALKFAAAALVLTVFAPGAAVTGAFQGIEPLPDRITFYTNREGNNEIFAMNIDGSGQRNLTRHYSEDRSPSWSPDSSRITYTSNRTGFGDIYVMNANGSNPERLTDNPTWDFHSDWSPLCAKVSICADRIPDPLQDKDGTAPDQD